MNSFIPWVGGKSKLLWIINKMAPDHYSRFIDVFGGSGTVTMSRPIQQGCMEVYNDFNSNLTNLFCCVKNRPLQEAEARLVQGIFRRYIAGESLNELTEALRQQDIPYDEGRLWNKNMVARILADTRYTGEKGYPKLIDEDQLLSLIHI